MPTASSSVASEDVAVPPLISGLRRALPRVQLIAPDGFAFLPQLVRDVGPAVEGMIVSQPQIAPSLLRGPTVRHRVRQAGRRDLLPVDGLRSAGGGSAARRHRAVRWHALYRYEGATRHARQDGHIGRFSFTPTGDTTTGSLTTIRMEHRRPEPLRAIIPPADAAAQP
jgi:hypothetical protein